MLRLTALTCALIASATCAARPMIIRESQLLQRPAGAGYTYFGYVVGIDGDWAVVTAGTASSRPTDPPNFHDALLYHRVNGQWTLDRTLVRRVAPDNDHWVGFGWAAMIFAIVAIFEQKSLKYILINGGYITVYFTLVGLILGAWR